MCKFIFSLSSRREMNEPRSPKVFPKGRTRRTQREEGRREFLVLLRLFFQNWDAPHSIEIKKILLQL